MASNEEEGLKQIFPQLVASLQANDIIDHLYQKSLLTDSEYVGFAKDIAQKIHSRDVNRGILMAVKKGPKGSISKFEEILRMSQPDLARELRKGKARFDPYVCRLTDPNTTTLQLVITYCT